MGKFGIHEAEFDSTNGNLQGFSRGLEFALSPVAYNRWKTIFYEWGHIILSHTMPSRHEAYMHHRSWTEAEAEILGMFCMNGAGLLDEETAQHSLGMISTGWAVVNSQRRQHVKYSKVQMPSYGQAGSPLPLWLRTESSQITTSVLGVHSPFSDDAESLGRASARQRRDGRRVWSLPA